MKVLLESIDGTQFPVEVGDPCTLQQLKEKVQETLEFPNARQILTFNQTILCQDTDLVDVKNGSVIKFRIIPDRGPEPEPEAELMDLQLDISPTKKITVKMRGGDTVYELKKKIQNEQGTPTDQMMLTTDFGRMEIPDNKRLRDCDLKFGPVMLEFLPYPWAWPKTKRNRLSMMLASSSSWPMLSLKLQFMGKTLPEAVEVRNWAMVKELRTKLDAMEFIESIASFTSKLVCWMRSALLGRTRLLMEMSFTSFHQHVDFF